MSPKNFTATRAWLFASLLFAWSAVFAGAGVGTVTDLSGPLLAKKTDGTAKILSQKSTVEQGDLLVTEKDTYARIKFVDNSEITLRPNTQFKIDGFSYAEDKPQNDSSVFSLIKGGLRAVTGALGKRSHEKVSVNTPAATIGIRGTTYVAEYIPESNDAVAAYGMASVAALDLGAMPGFGGTMNDIAQSPLSAAVHSMMQLAQNAGSGSGNGGLNPGLYVQVLDGAINVKNNGGSQNFTAGQFGFTPSFKQPPVILPNNPGLQFNPPPSFSNTTGSKNNTGSNSSKPGDVDCEVR